MTRAYKFRAPTSYLVKGIVFTCLPLMVFVPVFVYLRTFLLLVVIYSVIPVVLGVVGIYFLRIYLLNFTTQALKVEGDHIMLPEGRLSTILPLDEMRDVISTKGSKSIKIVHKKGIFFIQKSWMNKEDFEELRSTLLSATQKLA